MALFHSERGSVNYTIVGSPTIIDGVVSGFSSSDYLNISSGASFNSLEVVISLKDIPQIVNNQGCILRLSGDLNLTVYHQADGTVRVSYKGSDGNPKYIPAFDYANGGYFKIVISSTGAETHYSSDGSSYSAVSSLSEQPYSTSFTSAKWGYLSSTLQAFQGSIDLNHTYIKVNEQPWFGICPIEVKHIDYGAPVGYEVVGSPTIINGVASGFSASDYVNTSLSLNNTEEDFEIVISSIYKNLDSGLSNFIGGPFTIGGSYNYGQKLSSYIRNTQDEYVFQGAMGTTIMSDNMPYLLKMEQKKVNQQFVISIYISSDNGQTWILQNTASSNYPVKTSSPFIFGSAGMATLPTQYFRGSIDLNNTYIKINNKLWFYKPATNYVKCNDKLVFADSGLNLSGPVNYEVVGTPNIVDNVISGFTSSKYAETSENDQFNSASSWEVVAKFTLGDNVTTYSSIIGRNGNGFFNFGLDANRKPRLMVGENSSSYFATLLATDPLDNGKTYWMKGTFDGSVYNLYVSSDGISFNNVATYSSNKKVGEDDRPLVIGVGFVAKGPFNGSIDLNETYIKMDGSLWFYGKNYASKNIAPVPAGYPIGNTTTPAIGFVDMRTQTFTAAPEGAVLAKDEVSAESEN